MPTSKKIFTVENLAEKIKQAKGLVLVDYQGLNVAQINELRREIKKTGSEFEVVKNTLLSMATKNSSLSDQSTQLAGPTVAMWIYQDDFASLKTLLRFIEKNGLPKIKFGFWGKEAISAQKIEELAKLPGFNDLRAKLVGTLKAPLFGLNNSLSWNIKKLLFIFQSRISN